MTELLPCPCDDATLIEWLNSQIAFAHSNLTQANNEVAAFSARTDGDFSAFVGSWRTHAERCAVRLGKYMAIKALIDDRNEWREQHENLLSVRQSDLAAWNQRPAPSPADVEVVARVISGPILYEFDGWRLDRPITWGDVSANDQETLRDIARAAIAAMSARPDDERIAGLEAENAKLKSYIWAFTNALNKPARDMVLAAYRKDFPTSHTPPTEPAP